jgi:hypothetical protein
MSAYGNLFSAAGPKIVARAWKPSDEGQGVGRWVDRPANGRGPVKVEIQRMVGGGGGGEGGPTQRKRSILSVDQHTCSQPVYYVCSSFKFSRWRRPKDPQQQYMSLLMR